MSTEETAQERQALAVAAEAGIHRLAIPTPFMVGRVNAYLIEDSPLTLIDSGPNSGKALDDVAALDKPAPFLAAYGHETDLEDRFAQQLMLRHGIPQEVVTALRAVSAGFRAWGAAVEVTRPLKDGGELQLRDRIAFIEDQITPDIIA